MKDTILVPCPAQENKDYLVTYAEDIIVAKRCSAQEVALGDIYFEMLD